MGLRRLWKGSADFEGQISLPLLSRGRSHRQRRMSGRQLNTSCAKQSSESQLLSHNLGSDAEAWHHHYQNTAVRYGLKMLFEAISSLPMFRLTEATAPRRFFCIISAWFQAVARKLLQKLALKKCRASALPGYGIDDASNQRSLRAAKI